MHLTLGNVIMMAVGATLVYLALAKKYEPFLLIGIGFACIVANVPGSDLTEPGGLFYFAYQGVALVIIPPLIFLGVGAMTDFGPMIARPGLMILGAAAHAGIFIAIILAKMLGFTISEAGAIGIIGGADGPTAIFLSAKLAPHLIGAIAVAAYSYMALVPVIQPPIMKLLTTKEERVIRMRKLRKVSRLEKVLFPMVSALVIILLVPAAAPLMAMFMIGNLFREAKVVERLNHAAQNELLNIVTIFLGLPVGATMNAETFLQPKVIFIFFLGLFAFMISTATGVLLAKFMNLFTKDKINPLLGAAGVSAVPMAARVVHKVGAEADKKNYLLMYAMGPNVAGVIGTVIAAGVFLTILR